MAQKAPVNENASSSSPKYGFQHYKNMSGITDDLSPSEKLDRLHTLFKKLAAGTQAISDNLQPGELQRRLSKSNGQGVTPAQMKILLDENRHAIDLLRDCMLEMSLCTDTNRTAALAECSEIFKKESARLKAGIRAFNTVLSDNPVPDKTRDRQGLRPTVTGMVLQALPIVLALEDMIAA